MTRYFIHFAAPTPEEAHDRAEVHGAVREMKLHFDPLRVWVYGSAEVELDKEESDDGDIS